MARFSFTGLDAYVARLEKLTHKAHGQIKMSVWEGAKVAKDALVQGMNSIPVQEEFVPKNHVRSGIPQAEKEAILKNFGVAKMKEKGGSVDTHVGWEGVYKRGDKFIPIVTLVRQVESGTSWLRKAPFARRSVNAVRGKAEEAMRNKMESEINKITGGM